MRVSGFSLPISAVGRAELAEAALPVQPAKSGAESARRSRPARFLPHFRARSLVDGCREEP
jgi:hypothetical protein